MSLRRGLRFGEVGLTVHCAWCGDSAVSCRVVPLLVTCLIKLSCTILRGIVTSRVGKEGIQSQVA